MVRPLGTQPDAGTVVESQTAPFGLLPRHFQRFAPPQALDPHVVDQPAGVAQQNRDPPVTVAAVPKDQLDHVRNQPDLVITATKDTALDRAVLPQDPAGSPR